MHCAFLAPVYNRPPRQANRYQTIEKQRGFARTQVLEAMYPASLSELRTHYLNDVTHVTTADPNCQQQFSDPIRLPFVAGMTAVLMNQSKEIEGTGRVAS